MLIFADTPEMKDADIIMTIESVNSTSVNENNRLGDATTNISMTLSKKSVARRGKRQQVRLLVVIQFWDLILTTGVQEYEHLGPPLAALRLVPVSQDCARHL